MGNRLSLALFIIILREWDRSYIILAQLNIPEEQIPCATIIIILPVRLQKFKDKILIIIKAM